ncbi:MAG: hypothetical protein ACYCZN_08395 [Candidatus Dormibacteria bacterium]
MQESNHAPLIAELVEPAGHAPSPRQVVALLVAAAPLAARLGWWWWRQTRQTQSHAESARLPPAVFEHTEVRMTKRLLGRWKVRVTSTRWQPNPGAEPVSVRPRLSIARPLEVARFLLLSSGQLPAASSISPSAPVVRLSPPAARDPRPPS